MEGRAEGFLGVTNDMVKFLVFLLSLAAVCLDSAASFALVVSCPTCSSKAMEIIERATNLEKLQTAMNQYREDIQQTQQQISLVQNNIRQLDNMLLNTKTLPDQMVSNLKRSLGDLAKNTVELNVLKGDYMAIGQVFDSVYPGLDIIKGMAGGRNQSIHEIWDSWSKESDRAAQATFQLSAMQLKDLAENSDSLDDHITRLLNSPEGQMQAISAGNNLAAIQIAEAQKLRGLMAASIQGATADSAKKEKQEQLANENWRKFTGASEILSQQFK
jgi:P-type conjugative transfer protein TrbJ